MLVPNLEAHTIAAFNEVLKTRDFNPSTDWMQPDDHRKKICRMILSTNSSIFLSMGSDQPTRRTESTQYAVQIISLGFFTWSILIQSRRGMVEGLKGAADTFCLLWNSGRKNYANEILKTLYQLEFTLSPRHRKQLLWCRCVNVHGHRGKKHSSRFTYGTFKEDLAKASGQYNKMYFCQTKTPR